MPPKCKKYGLRPNVAEKLLLYIPLFLLGNFHCLGMCGPIAMMLGKSRWRHFYLIGRAAGFALAGLIAATFGVVITTLLQPSNLSALFSLFVGITLITSALLPLFSLFNSLLEPLNKKLTLLILKDRWWPTFLFGFATIALPCGQSLLIYSLAALSGNAIEGLSTTLLFALLTTPSLLFAFEMRRLLNKFYAHVNGLITSVTLFIGSLSCLRCFADLQYIPHFVLFDGGKEAMHIALW
jgi:sulfite exporter TauE/SafE